jgi:hypothetical protein
VKSVIRDSSKSRPSEAFILGALKAAYAATGKKPGRGTWIGPGENVCCPATVLRDAYGVTCSILDHASKARACLRHLLGDDEDKDLDDGFIRGWDGTEFCPKPDSEAWVWAYGLGRKAASELLARNPGSSDNDCDPTARRS